MFGYVVRQLVKPGFPSRSCSLKKILLYFSNAISIFVSLVFMKRHYIPTWNQTRVNIYVIRCGNLICVFVPYSNQKILHYDAITKTSSIEKVSKHNCLQFSQFPRPRHSQHVLHASRGHREHIPQSAETISVSLP